MTEICPQDTYWMTVWCLYRVWSTKNLLCCPCLLFNSLVIVIRLLAISLIYDSELKNSFKTTMQCILFQPSITFFSLWKEIYGQNVLGQFLRIMKKESDFKCQMLKKKKILYKIFVIFIHRIIHVILLEDCRNGFNVKLLEDVDSYIEI